MVEAEGEDEAAAGEAGDLNEEQWAVEYASGPLHVVEELLEAREGRLELLPELVEPDVGVGLDEDDALAGALDHELPVPV